MFWSDSGELVAISTEESFFILKFSSEAVEKARENPESISEDGIEEAFDVSCVFHRLGTYILEITMPSLIPTMERYAFYSYQRDVQSKTYPSARTC